MGPLVARSRGSVEARQRTGCFRLTQGKYTNMLSPSLVGDAYSHSMVAGGFEEMS